MWILKPDIKKAEEYADYYFRTFPRLFNKEGKRNYCGSCTHTETYKYLTKEQFRQFLVAKPQELLFLHEELFKRIISPFDQKEWELYIQEKEIETHNLDKKQAERRKAFDKVQNEIQAVNLFFNYDAHVSGNKILSYFLSEKMGTNTCTYCNRAYTLTVYEQSNAGEFEGLIRPEFDHWLPQSLYPDLTLSYFNLIPSCKLCNSSLKHKKKMDLDNYIHPYIDDEAGFNFRYIPLSDGHYAVNTVIESTDATMRSKIKNTLRLFHTQEVYNAHVPFELQDIMDLANANSQDYIEPLIHNTIRDLGVTVRDAYRMIFGIEFEKDLFLNRPFSKFKMDILKQLKEEKVIKK